MVYALNEAEELTHVDAVSRDKMIVLQAKQVVGIDIGGHLGNLHFNVRLALALIAFCVGYGTEPINAPSLVIWRLQMNSTIICVSKIKSFVFQDMEPRFQYDFYWPAGLSARASLITSFLFFAGSR